jgi:hypothetical protein
VEITVVDGAGRMVRTLYNGALPSDGRLLIDTSALPTGVYALTVRARSGQFSTRLVKR